MMKNSGFFSWLSGNKTESSQLPEEPQTLNQDPTPFHIDYDNTLIRKLSEDHTELGRLLNEIKAVSNHRGYMALPELLASFRLVLHAHLILEEVKFYTYVQQLYAKNVNLSSFISDVKKEMNDIASAVMNFIDTYTNQKTIEGNMTEFKRGLTEIGEILARRIHLEETRLFSLYMESYKQPFLP